MSAVFLKAIPVVLKAEGNEVSNNPNDYGHLTKYGISQRSYPYLNIAELTPNEAYEIWEKDFWKPNRLSEIEDQTIANQNLILLLNMDPREAIKIVQKGINNCGLGTYEVDLDGVMGSKTLATLNALNRFALSDRIRVEAITFYLNRVDTDPTQVCNLRSWIRRSLL